MMQILSFFRIYCSLSNFSTIYKVNFPDSFFLMTSPVFCFVACAFYAINLGFWRFFQFYTLVLNVIPLIPYLFLRTKVEFLILRLGLS